MMRQTYNETELLYQATLLFQFYSVNKCKENVFFYAKNNGEIRILRKIEELMLKPFEVCRFYLT